MWDLNPYLKHFLCTTLFFMAVDSVKTDSNFFVLDTMDTNKRFAFEVIKNRLSMIIIKVFKFLEIVRW